MLVGTVSNINFSVSHAIKTHWLKGDFPTVTRGLYGGYLTPDNVSLEHITPKSKGGRTELYNLALATKYLNNKRSSKPLKECLTQEQADEYLSQFRGVSLKDFNGDKYAYIVGKKIKRLLK